ncbi:MAG: hypothetical protein QF570_03965 [Myxococcota bacterium]|jgi:hypothetical protein|nr:hypothetical protein [Myxococcota bacterium]
MPSSTPHRKLAELSREELCCVGREYLLIGHLQDRVGLPMATRLVGEEAQIQLSIDEWMGASPIYSVRMQKALDFEGSTVATVFKNLQLEIGAPAQFMDFQFRLDSPEAGEFWLPHCGALLDVEPFGEQRVHNMCHAIEDPTFDATAAATHPCMKMRAIHRPPRNPSGRYPHCRWRVFIDQDDPTPYEQHPNLPLMRKSLIASVPIELPDEDLEPGGWPDYSGAFDPGFQLEDLSHRALLAVCQEAAVQAHLLARSFLLNVDQRHGAEAVHELGRGQWIGAAGVGAYRLKRALELDDSIESIATIFELHPHFQPRAYVDLSVETTPAGTLKVELRDCPALEEADDHSWFGTLMRGSSEAIQTIASVVNPKARCAPVGSGTARFAWEIEIDPSAEALDEPAEMKMARYSRGVDFELMARRPLRA